MEKRLKEKTRKKIIRSNFRVRGNKVPGKMVPGENSPEKWSPEKSSLEKCPPKIIPRRKNARKFERLFYFHRLILLHTQKDVWLNDSRKVCCRVLGFHWDHFSGTIFPVMFFPGFIFQRLLTFLWEFFLRLLHLIFEPILSESFD